MHLFPTESELIHGSRMKVLHKNVGTLNQFGKNLLAVGGSRIKSERFLVGI